MRTGLDSRVEPECAGSVKGERADVGRLQLVHPQQLETRLVQLFRGPGHRDPVGAGGGYESNHVLVEPEYGSPLRGLVGADALEDTRPVLKPVREEMNGCVVPIDELAVHPYLG